MSREVCDGGLELRWISGRQGERMTEMMGRH